MRIRSTYHAVARWRARIGLSEAPEYDVMEAIEQAAERSVPATIEQTALIESMVRPHAGPLRKAEYRIVDRTIVLVVGNGKRGDRVVITCFPATYLADIASPRSEHAYS